MRRIAAVAVNHNTSLYTELMLRSLMAAHPPLDQVGLSLTILDNDSEDDSSSLRAYAQQAGVPVLPSGFTTHTKHNSHGEILRRFVLDHPGATHYLFLDADAYFSQPNAISTMADELDVAPGDVFAIGARIASPWEPDTHNVVEPERIAGLYERRLHPFCALFRNTALFRRVADQIGFHCYRALWAEREQYLDTCELLSVALRAFGYRFLHSSALVAHFFAVSYDMYGQERLGTLAKQRDVLLAALRERDLDRPTEGPRR